MSSKLTTKQCPICGVAFTSYICHDKRYCSRPCATRGMWADPHYRQRMSECHRGPNGTALPRLAPGEITQSLLKEMFEYRAGGLYWRAAPSRRHLNRIGQRAGTINRSGYRQLSIRGRIILEHRLIFMWHHGWLPNVIDHIDRDRQNNCIENLRAVDAAQNAWNRGDDVAVAYFNRESRQWHAQIMVRGKRINLGFFTSEQEAISAYQSAKLSRDREGCVR